MKKKLFFSFLMAGLLAMGSLVSTFGNQTMTKAHAEETPINVVFETEDITNVYDYSNPNLCIFDVSSENDLPVNDTATGKYVCYPGTGGVMLTRDGVTTDVGGSLAKNNSKSYYIDGNNIQYYEDDDGNNYTPYSFQAGDVLTINGTFTNVTDGSTHLSITINDVSFEKKASGWTIVLPPVEPDEYVVFDNEAITIDTSSFEINASSNYVFAYQVTTTNSIAVNGAWDALKSFIIEDGAKLYRDDTLVASTGLMFCKNNPYRYTIIFITWANNFNDFYRHMQPDDMLILKGSVTIPVGELYINVTFDIELVIDSSMKALELEDLPVVLDYTSQSRFCNGWPSNYSGEIREDNIRIEVDSWLPEDQIPLRDPFTGEESGDWTVRGRGENDVTITRANGEVHTVKSVLIKTADPAAGYKYFVCNFANYENNHVGFQGGDKVEVNSSAAYGAGGKNYVVKVKGTCYFAEGMSNEDPWLTEADYEPVAAVVDLINQIGTVSYDAASLEKITTAKDAYDLLTKKQKGALGEVNLDKLNAAISAYNEFEIAEHVDEVVDLVDAIGTVEYTEESYEKIVAARAAYDALTDEEKSRLPAGTLEALEAAEAAYKVLKDTADAAQVVDLIDAIGAVTYSDESLQKIATARAAYNALSDEAKELVTNYNVLVAAEEAYETARRQDRADTVISLINAIGEVDGTLDCLNRIDEARFQYDALDNNVKNLVTNYNVLTKAEADFIQVVSEAKASALARVKAIYDALDLTKYSEENAELLHAYYVQTTEAIKVLNVVDDLDSFIEAFQNAVNSVETLPANNVGLIIIIVVSSVVVLAGAAVAIILVLKRKKKVA